MKFLVTVKPSEQMVPPPEQAAALLRASAETLRRQVNARKLDCAYSTGQAQGFGIANAASVEEVWELVFENPLAAFWSIEVTALGDAIALTELQARTITASQPLAAGSRN